MPIQLLQYLHRDFVSRRLTKPVPGEVRGRFFLNSRFGSYVDFKAFI